MKRFIDLGSQTGNIDESKGEKEFAFYCTSLDKFETFSGCQTWFTRQDFINDYEGNELNRFLKLIPSDWA
jgi:hypothetical protein